LKITIGTLKNGDFLSDRIMAVETRRVANEVEERVELFVEVR